MHSLHGQGKTPPPPEFVAWLPISDAERALKSPLVEKDAGAEVLTWRVRVIDEVVGQDLQRALYNYVRVKVFDEKGKEKMATLDLAYREPGAILSVAARTIKADGSVVDLDPKTVTKRDLFRAGRIREKAVSFAMPAVEPGAIVDYRWKQTEDDNRFRYIRLHFQRDLPVEKVTYYVRPLPAQYTGDEHMLMMPFHCKPTTPAMDLEGWQETSVENIPALIHEPYAPSEPNLEQWALLYYHNGSVKSSDKFWSDEGRQVFKKIKDTVKISEDVKAAANDAIGDAKNEDEKISRLAAYLRKHVRNLSDPDVTAGDRQQYFEKLPRGRDRNLAEVFKSGLATPNEMNIALVGLAQGAGLDARLSLVEDRTEVLFNPKVMTDRYFLDGGGVAIKTANGWRIVDATERLIAPDMLPWQKEGIYALVSDAKEPVFIHTPISPPEASRTARIAYLKLSEEGDLAGDVEERYTGHRAEEYRGELDGQSPAEREQTFRDRLGRMFPESEITKFNVADISDTAKPLRVSYHLEAPHFAQITGKRMLFQPNVFRRARAALFTASERKNTVEFPYAWQDVDHIAIELPAGFELDNADSPISSWLSRLMDGPAEVTPAIRAKAVQLTANASGELDKIRALAAFVQSTTYVSVDMNITRGGGYTPHRAEDTLTRNYGDCKDKATLLRALLKASGIQAFPLAVYSSDRTLVRPEWASPFQFNHLIVAIRVSDGITLPTVLPHTSLGRLLIFDPTDPITAVGDLPLSEQGSKALLVSRDHGSLVEMPTLAVSANRVESIVEAAMDDAGRIEATFQREYYGQSGVGLREVEKLEGSPELKKLFERGLSRRLAGLSIKRLETKPSGEETFAVDMDLSSDHFGQLMQGHLFVVRPGLLVSGGRYFFTATPRHAPIHLQADARHDSIRIKLPGGFKLDELPAPAKVESPFGRMEASWVVRDGQLWMDENVEIRETFAPPSDYPQIRAFFNQLSGAEGAPVIFAKN